MSIDNNAIVHALRGVKDPNSGQDIISVRMVEDLKIDGPNVSFSINLTTICIYVCYMKYDRY